MDIVFEKAVIMDELLRSYVSFLEENDPEKLDAITKKIYTENQYETPEITMMHYKVALADSMMDNIINPSQSQKKNGRKKTSFVIDYQALAQRSLKESKRIWAEKFFEKNLSTESTAHFRRLFKKIIGMQKGEGNERKLCQRCASFIGELQKASGRSSRKKNVESFMDSHAPAIFKKEAHYAREDLVTEILKAEPTFKKSFLGSLSRPEKENLIFTLKNISLEARRVFVGFPKLKKLIASNSDFMEAVRFGDQDEILSMLGIRKTLPENIQEDQTVCWKDYVFPKNTTIKFISAATKNTTHVSRALKEINVRPIFLHTSKVRLIGEVVKGNDMLVLVTGFIDHKIQQKLDSMGRDYVTINYIYSSSICQRLIEACLKKGIPLACKK